jgi:excisionase family DNA binding protein
MSKHLTSRQAAVLLGIHDSTLRTWTNAGRIPFTLTAGGHRRFDRAVIETWAAGQQEPMSREATEAGRVAAWARSADLLLAATENDLGEAPTRRLRHPFARLGPRSGRP